VSCSVYLLSNPFFYSAYNLVSYVWCLFSSTLWLFNSLCSPLTLWLSKQRTSDNSFLHGILESLPTVPLESSRCRRQCIRRRHPGTQLGMAGLCCAFRIPSYVHFDTGLGCCDSIDAKRLSVFCSKRLTTLFWRFKLSGTLGRRMDSVAISYWSLG
jgi:hypothetical protein